MFELLWARTQVFLVSWFGCGRHMACNEKGLGSKYCEIILFLSQNSLRQTGHKLSGQVWWGSWGRGLILSKYFVHFEAVVLTVWSFQCLKQRVSLKWLHLLSKFWLTQIFHRPTSCFEISTMTAFVSIVRCMQKSRLYPQSHPVALIDTHVFKLNEYCWIESS